MPSIRVLPPHIANQIAAGEVVERPSSVVKELVENSLDASATKVSVYVERGGKELIRVVDNGTGMPPQDLELALERHATSKIATEEDLYAIKSLGFRGEALPSIASVSDFTIKSAVDNSTTGWMVEVHFGRDKKGSPCACPKGTIVEVRDLFLEIPARRRFLKGDQTELAHINRMVRTYAVAFPEVNFKLSTKRRVLFESPSRGNDLSTLAPLLGDEIIPRLRPVEASGYGITIKGAVSGPGTGTSGPRLCHFFLNRRPFQSRLVLKAVREALRGEFLRNEYPALVLFFELDPGLVDVNCHPTKQEVRFKNGDKVFRLIYSAVKNALARPVATTISVTEDFEVREPVGPEYGGDKGHEGVREEALFDFPIPSSSGKGEIPSNLRKIVYSAHQEAREEPELMDQTRSKPCLTGTVEILGQVLDTYIVGRTNEGLFLMDQHSAHEALVFKRINRELDTKGTISSQRLAFPMVFSIGPEEIERFKEVRRDLLSLGLELDLFGEGEVAVRSIPTVLSFHAQKENVIRGLIQKALGGEFTSPKELLYDIASKAACKSAVKAGHGLETVEMETLVAECLREGVSHCPHGRPVFVLLGAVDLEKLFRRR